MFSLVNRHEQEQGSASDQVALDKDLWVAPLKNRNVRPNQMKKFPNFFAVFPNPTVGDFLIVAEQYAAKTDFLEFMFTSTPPLPFFLENENGERVQVYPPHAVNFNTPLPSFRESRIYYLIRGDAKNGAAVEQGSRQTRMEQQQQQQQQQQREKEKTVLLQIMQKMLEDAHQMDKEYSRLAEQSLTLSTRYMPREGFSFESNVFAEQIRIRDRMSTLNSRIKQLQQTYETHQRTLERLS